MTEEAVKPRAMGVIIVSFDPNTQNVGLRVEGLTPVEVTGLLGWCQHLYLASNKVGSKEEQQMVVPAQVIPHS